MPTEREYRPNSDNFNEATKRMHMAHEVYNSTVNHPVIMQAIADGRARDITSEPKVRRTPCLIIGSGPSLDDATERMKEWQGGIICSTSQALTLMRHGIEPTHIMALDVFSTWDELKGVDWAKTRTKLITNPAVWPDTIANWPNEMLLYRMNMGNRVPFYNNEQSVMYSERVQTSPDLRLTTYRSLIPTGIAVFACSPPTQMFAADIMGYGTVFSVGVDFCYHSGKERFTNWTVGEDGEWIEHHNGLVGQSATTDMAPDNQAIITDNGYQTHQIHIFYKKNYVSAWRMSGQNAYVVGKGSITEMPRVDWDEVVDKQGKGYRRWTAKDIMKVTDKYLAERDSFVIEAAHGRAFVETPSIDGIIQMMMEMNRKYKCDNCKAEMEAGDAANHTGDECPACKKGKILRSNPVDIEANLRRFNKLVKLYHTEPAAK